MHDHHAQPRSLETIDDDLAWAVLDGNESVIAALQQERLGVLGQIKELNVLD